jgi:hypothetical protein
MGFTRNYENKILKKSYYFKKSYGINHKIRLNLKKIVLVEFHIFFYKIMLYITVAGLNYLKLIWTFFWVFIF